MVGEGNQQHPNRQRPGALNNQPRFTEPARQPADQTTLDGGAKKTDEGEQITVLFRPPTELPPGPHGKSRFKAGKNEGCQKGHQNQQPEVGTAQGLAEHGQAFFCRLGS